MTRDTRVLYAGAAGAVLIALGLGYGFARMTQLMGFPDVWEFEKKWAQGARNGE